MLIRLILILLLSTNNAFAALGANTIWDLRATATASNVNGGGFNTGNVNFLTDLTTDANTANTASPVISSASYSFVAGDDESWVYIKSGTNWTPGLYQIASVSGGKATLRAAVGEATQRDSNTGLWLPNTVVGCATVGTPTGGTFGMNYSMQDAAKSSGTDLASTNGTTNPSVVTSATVTFGPEHVGNIIHITAGTSWTANWYEIVSVSGGAATLDAAVGSSATLSNGTFYVGGAMSMNSTLDDDFMEILIGGNVVHIKAGTYSTGETVAVASTSSSSTNPVSFVGYSSVWGDLTSETGGPTISVGANNFTLGQYMRARYTNWTGTSASAGVLALGTSGQLYRSKIINTSSTGSRIAISLSGADGSLLDVEAVSLNGTAVSVSQQGGKIIGSYMHNSNIGISHTSTRLTLVDSVLARNKTDQYTSSAAGSNLIFNNSFIGTNTPSSKGYESTVATHHSNRVYNNIFWGLTTAIDINSATQNSNMFDWNNFYNNTTNMTNATGGRNDITLDPSFTTITELTGTTATSSGSVLTDSGADFSNVTDNVDIIRITSCTSCTVANYLITSHTATTLTLNNAIGTGSNINYILPIGHNYAVGTNMKAAGTPGLIGTETTSYKDLGGVQRQEQSGGSGGNYPFIGN